MSCFHCCFKWSHNLWQVIFVRLAAGNRNIILAMWVLLWKCLWLTLVALVFALYIQLCSHFIDSGTHVVFRAYLLPYNSYANFYCLSLLPILHVLGIRKTEHLVRVNSDHFFFHNLHVPKFFSRNFLCSVILKLILLHSNYNNHYIYILANMYL